ncbi:MotA/TolQ/ExbB proton channel family protein [Draconibacterium orientale]|uniref:MotA/TolQ/ExbB proton channel family protein n=2 Tax=Draconibacterium orientale TaxID=1168034 RepID=A0A1I0CSS6_9BACT|nr:MotA/TolQ/ExbB proton channel family protein [Draconibacterium orientale]SET22840.1 MotA/TolQ/ExbB proton channel family protein [Draconibacterium orientale]
MNFLEFHKAGGPNMGVISLMGLLVLVIAGIKIYQMVVLKQYNLKLIRLIRMGGLFAAAFGVLSQIIGIVQALEAIRAASDISPEIVMGGAIVSFYSTIWGLIVLLVSLPIYYVLKEFIKLKMTGNN